MKPASSAQSKTLQKFVFKRAVEARGNITIRSIHKSSSWKAAGAMHSIVRLVFPAKNRAGFGDDRDRQGRGPARQVA